jgi:hypothetical protein
MTIASRRLAPITADGVADAGTEGFTPATRPGASPAHTTEAP